jgi:hypothetical protein
MSKQMYRSFIKAEEEALLEVRRENNRFWQERESAEREWDKQNLAEWSKIRDTYHLKNRIIDEQIKALREAQTQAFEDMRKQEDEMYSKRYKDIEPLLESSKEAREANSKKWREIEAQVVAKYEARLQKASA